MTSIRQHTVTNLFSRVLVLTIRRALEELTRGASVVARVGTFYDSNADTLYLFSAGNIHKVADASEKFGGSREVDPEFRTAL